MTRSDPWPDIETPDSPRQRRTLPLWRPLAAVRPAMSPDWWRWIASRDSLTARLIAAAGERPFRVALLGQGPARPRLDEARALEIPFDRHAWCREVALCVADRPWVVARSVVPLAGLRGQRLERLGERSLGSWLFRQPGLQRSPIEVTTTPPPFHALAGPWGRRSVFRHRGASILVQEWFLATMADDLGLPSR